MFSQSTIVRTSLLTVLVMAIIAVVMGANRGVNQSGIQERIVGDRVLSRVQLFNLNESIARLDTVTGELFLYSGDFGSPSSRGQWRLYVSGVSNTSGYLEVQQPRGVEAQGTIFLVDIVTGDTWSFSRRGVGRASWDHVGVFRR